jgi:hypothetical protein
MDRFCSFLVAGCPSQFARTFRADVTRRPRLASTERTSCRHFRLRHWILAGARRASACCRGHGPRSRFGIRSIHESQRTGKGDDHIWKLQPRAA